jgi:DNA-binding transcriptional regulator YiaG
MKDWTPPEIEEFRKARRFTRRKLGEMLGGVTVSTIFKWERGLRTPSKMGKVLLSKIEAEFKMKGGEKDGSKRSRKKTR